MFFSYLIFLCIAILCCFSFFFFFFNDTATTEIYTLSLHDALPILAVFKSYFCKYVCQKEWDNFYEEDILMNEELRRSEEHTSELQSQSNLVCRLLLEKKKKNPAYPIRS